MYAVQSPSSSSHHLCKSCRRKIREEGLDSAVTFLIIHLFNSIKFELQLIPRFCSFTLCTLEIDYKTQKLHFKHTRTSSPNGSPLLSNHIQCFKNRTGYWIRKVIKSWLTVQSVGSYALIQCVRTLAAFFIFFYHATNLVGILTRSFEVVSWFSSKFSWILRYCLYWTVMLMLRNP